MAWIVIGFGSALVLLGIGAYVGSEMASVTALIPAFFGAAVLVCGVAASRPRWARGAVIGASAVAVLGVVGSLARIVPKVLRGEAVRLDLAAGTQIATAALCAALAIACVAWLVRRKPVERGGA